MLMRPYNHPPLEPPSLQLHTKATIFIKHLINSHPTDEAEIAMINAETSYSNNAFSGDKNVIKFNL